MTVLQMPRRGRGNVRPAARSSSSSQPKLNPSSPLRVFPLLMEEGGVVRFPPEVQACLGVKPGAPLYVVLTGTIYTLRDAESYEALRAGVAPGATQELLTLVTMRIEVKP